jgi:hypothetical protein
MELKDIEKRLKELEFAFSRHRHSEAPIIVVEHEPKESEKK